MKPYYERNGVTLYHADCLDILPTLESGSVDAVVTDPPYGIGFKYESHNDSPDGYGPWLWERIEAAENLCSQGSPVFVWQAMLNCRYFSQWFPREYRLFAAAKNFVQIRPTAMQHSFDPVLVWWTDGVPYRLERGNKDFHIADTASLVSNSNNLEKGHPCPRPIDQVVHVVEHWVVPAGTTIDPFTGSGTTGVACVQLGRKFVGIEIEEKYCAIAAKRIDKAIDEVESEARFFGVKN